MQKVAPDKPYAAAVLVDSEAVRIVLSGAAATPRFARQEKAIPRNVERVESVLLIAS